MTDYLLDTCTALWLMADSDKLPRNVAERLTDPTHRLLFSDVSLLEIVIKHRLGKLGLRKKPSQLFPKLPKEHGCERLPLGAAAILRLESLPMHHRDPFDRLLVTQALVHKLVLVSPDPKLRKYDAEVFWK